MFRLCLLIVSFLMVTNSFAQTQDSKPTTTSDRATIQFVGDFKGLFSNPERGWHKRRNINGAEIDSKNYSDVIAGGHSLLHSYIRLDEFEETDIVSQSFLDNLQKTLDTIRIQGLKVILRPTHVWLKVPKVSENRILKHIEQLNVVLSKNADVISHLEVGYLGKWGEWHSGIYTDLSNKADGATRYRIIERILNTTPDNMPIVMRYPMHIKEILEEIQVPEGSKPLTQIQKDRIGHHNDCFLFNDNDRGTYLRDKLWFGNQSVDQQKQYTFNMKTSFGGNVMMGGETCSPAIERINDTQTDMVAANWTELNLDFWVNAIKLWKERILPASGNDPKETEFNRISRKLGYRLRLIDVNLPSTVKVGEDFSFSAHFNNDGYAGIIKKRPIYLVLDNGKERYNIELKNRDVRVWLSGSIQINNQICSLPKNIKQGSYKLAIWLPDSATNLQDIPSYSIRFANLNTWDSVKGYNVIKDSFIIN